MVSTFTLYIVHKCYFLGVLKDLLSDELLFRCFEKISENGGVTRAQYENMFAKYLGSQESV